MPSEPTPKLPVCIARRHATDDAEYDSELGWGGWCYTCDRPIAEADTVKAAPCPTCHGIGYRVGGAAPSAPTADAHMIHGLERCIAAAHRLLDGHHDATVVDRQDAEDAERLLAWLRGDTGASHE